MHNLDFGGALVALKQGFKVSRLGWLDGCVYIKILGSDEDVTVVGPTIFCFSTHFNPVYKNMWMPYQGDLLALDWGIVD